MSVSRREGGLSAAFVTFSRHESAKRAKEDLDGFGFRYLVLKVEWAKPSNRDVTSTGMGGAHMSGYGKALPQNMNPLGGGGASAAARR